MSTHKSNKLKITLEFVGEVNVHNDLAKMQWQMEAMVAMEKGRPQSKNAKRDGDHA